MYIYSEHKATDILWENIYCMFIPGIYYCCAGKSRIYVEWRRTKIRNIYLFLFSQKKEKLFLFSQKKKKDVEMEIHGEWMRCNADSRVFRRATSRYHSAALSCHENKKKLKTFSGFQRIEDVLSQYWCMECTGYYSDHYTMKIRWTERGILLLFV